MFYICIRSECPENTFTEVMCSRVCRVALSVKQLRYGLDSAGIETRWGRDISHLYRSALGPRSLLYNGNRFSLLGVRRSRRVVNYPPHLAPSLKKSRVVPLIPDWAFMSSAKVNIMVYLFRGNAASFMSQCLGNVSFPLAIVENKFIHFSG